MTGQLKVNCEVIGRRAEEQSALYPGFEYEIIFPGTDRLEGHASMSFRRVGIYRDMSVYEGWGVETHHAGISHLTFTSLV